MNSSMNYFYDCFYEQEKQEDDLLSWSFRRLNQVPSFWNNFHQQWVYKSVCKRFLEYNAKVVYFIYLENPLHGTPYFMAMLTIVKIITTSLFWQALWNHMCLWILITAIYSSAESLYKRWWGESHCLIISLVLEFSSIRKTKTKNPVSIQ